MNGIILTLKNIVTTVFAPADHRLFKGFCDTFTLAHVTPVTLVT